MRHLKNKFLILCLILLVFFLFMDCTESRTSKDEDKDKECDIECILPFSTEVQDKLYYANPYNEIYSDGTRDEGFDFEFKFDPDSVDITEEDLINGYVLYRVVAPCDGIIEDIIHGEIIEGTLNGMFCPGYGVSIGIRYNKNWITAVTLETHCYEEEDIKIQKEQIFVEVEDKVKQGDLLAYFIVTHRIVSEELIDNFSYPIIDWRLYRIDTPIIDIAELRDNSVCPYSKCTPDAKLELEEIFSRFYGDDYVICVP